MIPFLGHFQPVVHSSHQDSVELHPTRTKFWLFALVWEEQLLSVAAACNIIIIKQDVKKNCQQKRLLYIIISKAISCPQQ